MKRHPVRVVFRPITLALAIALSAVVANACSGSSLRSSDHPRAAAMTAAPLPPGEGDSDAFPCTADDAELCMEHAYLVIDGMVGLGELQRTRDLRSIPVAFAALSGTDAHLQYEALRLLGPWADEPGVQQAVLPFLLNPRPRLRQMAARIVKKASKGADLGEQYAKGHPKEDNFDPYDRDPPRDPQVWGHVAFPGASPYPPGDSERSLGYSTVAPLEDVTRFYEQKTGRGRMDMRAFSQLRALGAIPKMEQAGAIADEYQRTQNPELLKKLEALMQEGQGGAPAALPLPAREKVGAANVLVIDQNKPDARFVLLYREPAFDRTIALLAWDPSVVTAPVPTTTPLRYKAAPAR